MAMTLALMAGPYEYRKSNFGFVLMHGQHLNPFLLKNKMSQFHVKGEESIAIANY